MNQQQYAVYRQNPGRNHRAYTLSGTAPTLEQADDLAAKVYRLRAGKLIKARTTIRQYPATMDVYALPWTIIE